MEDKEHTISPAPTDAGSDSPVNGGLSEEETGASVDQNLSGDGGDPAGAGGGEGGMRMEPVVTKRKRGRPKKSRDENETRVFQMPRGYSAPPFLGFPKRGRGRPRGSGRLQMLNSLGGIAAETAGTGFTPHIVCLHAGEDLVNKVLSFSHMGTRAISILSAIGGVSSVVLRQPCSAAPLRYEGRFEIVSLSGSFVFGEIGGAHRKKGWLTASFVNPDRQVFGGAVVGPLIAGGPIQLVVGSFKPKVRKGLRTSRRSAGSSMTAVGPGSSSDGTRVPEPMAKITNGDENCVTPTSACSEATHGRAGNIVIDEQNLNPVSIRTAGWSPWQPPEVI